MAGLTASRSAAPVLTATAPRWHQHDDADAHVSMTGPLDVGAHEQYWANGREEPPMPRLRAQYSACRSNGSPIIGSSSPSASQRRQILICSLSLLNAGHFEAGWIAHRQSVVVHQSQWLGERRRVRPRRKQVASGHFLFCHAFASPHRATSQAWDKPPEKIFPPAAPRRPPPRTAARPELNAQHQ